MSFPSPADDHADKPLNLHDYLVARPASTFFWRYAGHTMAGAGILNGALVVVDRSLEVREGDIVLAHHLGQWVLRRLRKAGRQHRLVSEPVEGEGSVLDAAEDTLIWGVVTHAVNTLRAGAVGSDRYADLSD